ncbi:MAG: LacI family DNA-binding transcriptional regulator [Herpetosiphon sp.]
MPKGVTIHDVARVANVSTSTVSNLLNDRNDRMRPETTQRIHAAIDQLGYVPNRIARQLKTGHVPIIGLIVPSVANPFWGAFARYVEDAAAAHGYQVLLGNGERDPRREHSYAATLWEHGVRGVMLGSSPLSYEHLMGLAERGLKVVAFDREIQSSDLVAIDSITIDNVLAARLATNHLLALGHRRIGFLSGPLGTVSRRDRLAGYRAALAEAGVEPTSELIREEVATTGFGDNEGAAHGRRGARKLLSLPNPPTALLAINDMFALGAYAGARDVGLRVPDGVSIVGFDDIVLADIVDPPLTTVRQPLPEMMQTAVAFLIGRINGTRTGAPEHIAVVPDLIIRGSTSGTSTPTIVETHRKQRAGRRPVPNARSRSSTPVPEEGVA